MRFDSNEIQSLLTKQLLYLDKLDSRLLVVSLFHVLIIDLVLQCPQQTCPLFEVSPLCVSQCASCGTLCEAFPILDLASLQLYSTLGCTVVVGDLYIQSLAASVTKKLLLNNLQGVRYINGNLHFKDNQYISAMTFFSNLVGLYGAFYSNNAELVDARMPGLQGSIRNGVSVEGCDRLCPARYTAVGTVGDDSGCTDPLMKYFLNIVGTATVNDLALLSRIMARVVVNVTNSGVCTTILVAVIYFF